MILILDNIRSVHNVGSIFRTADAAGVEKIYLCGYTPTPLDRFNKPRKDLAKVALGAELTVPWEHTKSLSVALKNVKAQGYTVAAVEQDKHSIPLFEYKAPEKLTLVFGNEVQGLTKNKLRHCDVILEIPMRGKKESLNVSVTAGIAIFRLLH